MASHIGRRKFLATLGGAASAAWPLATRAQQPDRLRRIGMLVGAAGSDPEAPLSLEAFRQTLNQLGWKEEVLRVDTRWGNADPDRMSAYAKELISTGPDVAVADSTPAALALQRESRTTPIIFIQAGNPVGSGLVANLARPGGNLTGFTNYVPSMGGKWLELLKEVAPRVNRVAALFNPQTHTGQYWDVLQAATQSLGVTFGKAGVEDPDGIARAIEAMAGEPAGGVIVMPDTFTMSHRETIVALAARHHVPTVYPFRVFAVEGGLMSYGMNRVGVYRDAASYVDRVLRGEKPGDLPVQAPTTFELVVNLKTAKALGLDVPWFLQQRADEVIE